MKEAMLAHVEMARHSMFRDATERVKTDLNNMCTTIEKLMSGQIEDLSVRLIRDYDRALVGVNSGAIRSIRRAERALRTELVASLVEADAEFAKLVSGPKIESEAFHLDETWTS